MNISELSKSQTITNHPEGINPTFNYYKQIEKDLETIGNQFNQERARYNCMPQNKELYERQATQGLRKYKTLNDDYNRLLEKFQRIEVNRDSLIAELATAQANLVAEQNRHQNTRDSLSEALKSTQEKLKTTHQALDAQTQGTHLLEFTLFLKSNFYRRKINRIFKIQVLLQKLLGQGDLGAHKAF